MCMFLPRLSIYKMGTRLLYILDCMQCTYEVFEQFILLLRCLILWILYVSLSKKILALVSMKEAYQTDNQSYL